MTTAGRAPLALAGAVGLALLAGMAAARLSVADSGEVELRVTDHRAGIADFDAVHLSLTEILLHPSGRPRAEGWVSVLKGAPAIDIVPLKDGRWTTVGIVRVPAHRYDAIRVKATVIRAHRKAGKPVPIESLSTTVALGFSIDRLGRVPILLDFYLEDQTDHDPPRYELKLRRAAVGATASGG